MNRPRSAPPKRRVVLLLALVGGWVDAVCFLVLLHLFMGHMSGNSIGMSAYLGQGKWSHAFQRMFPIPCFLLGIVLGSTLIQVLAQRRTRSVFGPAWAVEAALLLLFALAGNPLREGEGLPLDPAWRFYLLAALPALAMGIQNATLHRVGGQSVRTTYVSGMLTNLAEGAVEYAFARYRGTALRRAPTGDNTPAGLALLFAIWLSYVVGGALGALADTHWGLWSLFVPVGGLLAIMTYDLLHPLPAEVRQEGG